MNDYLAQQESDVKVCWRLYNELKDKYKKIGIESVMLKYIHNEELAYGSMRTDVNFVMNKLAEAERRYLGHVKFRENRETIMSLYKELIEKGKNKKLNLSGVGDALEWLVDSFHPDFRTAEKLLVDIERIVMEAA